MSNMTEDFSGAIRRGARGRTPAGQPDREFTAMEEAHRGVMAFMREIIEASEQALLAYREAATANGIRTRLGWRMTPGWFDRPASEYGQDGGVPWLTLADVACGVDIAGFAFTRLEEGPEGGQWGYRLAGTGILITGGSPDGVMRETAREIASGTRRRMEEHLERRGYR